MTVLVVDDERHNTDLVRRALQPRKEIAVITAGNGREALDMLRREAVVMVVVDQRMPGMTGVEMLTVAQDAGLSVPTIMATAFPSDPDVLRAVQDGLVHVVVTKPWAAYEMLAAITRLLERL